jgi:hypothetical protein
MCVCVCVFTVCVCTCLCFYWQDDSAGDTVLNAQV